MGEANKAVISAIVGNLLITVTKLVAAAFSGSAAMLAEAVHSIVDAGNDGLILLGIRRSRRPANEDHPLGHGHELYFWSLVVGILIFGLGGGVSIVMGVVHIVNRSRPEAGVWSYVVLGTAAIFEAISWYFGFMAFRKEQRGRGIVETIRRSKNPSTFSVLLEDSAALLGLMVAFLGLSLAAKLDMPWIDGAASVAIGALLCGVAIVMVYESKGLLVGEGMEPAALSEIRELVAADRDVEHVGSLLSLYLGPEDVLLAIELRVLPQTTLSDLRGAIARIKKTIQQRYPRVRHVFLDT
jgi:cation diffusion facilitator family transporter